MIQKRGKQGAAERVFAALLCAVPFAILFVIHCYIQKDGLDDYYYGSFTTGGIGYYFHMLAENYTNRNGRTFVHALCALMLTHNLWPFRVFNVLVLFGFSFFGGKLAGDGRRPLLFCAAALSLLMLTGIAVLREAVFWASGSFNYLFPTTLVIVFFFCLRNLPETGARRFLILPLGLIAGASTEISGVLAIAAALYTLKKPYKLRFATLITSAVGFLTLLLSPGMRGKYAQSSAASAGIFERMHINLSLFSQEALTLDGLPFLLSLTLIAAALWLLFRGGKRLRPLSAVFFALAVLSVLTYFDVLNRTYQINGTALLACAALALFAVLQYLRGERIIPFSLLCALLSLGVCLVSTVCSARMLFPAAAFFAVTALRSFAICEFPRKIALCAAVLLVAAASIILVSFTGIYSNIAATRDQPAAAQLSVAAYDGDALVTDEIIFQNGTYYIGIRALGNYLGGEVAWVSQYAARITYNGHEYYFRQFAKNALIDINGGYSRSLHSPIVFGYTSYISVEDAQEIFNIDIYIK
ncbi:MAG: DUF6056 family protein [Oscillospiraceae bacterium]|jgi:hypothetical protein|nr:DUF6056 family protein [Oscillospiraceae bacterium]